MNCPTKFRDDDCEIRNTCAVKNVCRNYNTGGKDEFVIQPGSDEHCPAFSLKSGETTIVDIIGENDITTVNGFDKKMFPQGFPYIMRGHCCLTPCPYTHAKIGSYFCTKLCLNFLEHDEEKQIVFCKGEEK
jgi:hypothetical protein